MKLGTFFLRYQAQERVLRVNKSEITGQNNFHGDFCEIEDSHESSRYEKT